MLVPDWQASSWNVVSYRSREAGVHRDLSRGGRIRSDRCRPDILQTSQKQQRQHILWYDAKMTFTGKTKQKLWHFPTDSSSTAGKTQRI